MKRTLKWAGVVVVVLLAVGGGYVAGYTRAFWQGRNRLMVETTGNLSFRIEALSRLRTGDIDGSIAMTEMLADTAVFNLMAQGPFDELPKNTQRVLSAAKLYRSVYPSQKDEVTQALSGVPSLPLDHEFCSDALRQVAQMQKTQEQAK